VIAASAPTIRGGPGEVRMATGWERKAEEILLDSSVPFQRDFPLARLTTLGVGGPADLLARPAAVEPVAQALDRLTRAGIPFAFLGAGSNLIVSDAGYRGLVFCFADATGELEVRETRVRASAGWRLPSLVARLTRAGLSGLEWAEGIPGTVGGAVRMNAGAFRDSMQSSVREVTLVGRSGSVERRAVTPADFAYRSAPFVGEAAVAEAVFQLTPRSPAEIEEILRPIREYRKRTQPQGVRSSGCIWKNPPGSAAGRLIQEAGLKGTVRGGARISEVHGNFIVNTGGATFDDVMALADRIREKVLRDFGVELELEVEVWR
jgi:UDP-N-acetylmuramate dehydrogenase